MTQLLALSPFLAFAFVERLVGPTEGLIAGTLAATFLIMRDEWSLHRKAKLFDIAAALLFYALVARSVIFGMEDSNSQTRLYVDIGLTLVLVTSLVLGRPLSLQYVRERVAKDQWDRPYFIRTNYIVSLVWAGALATITVIDGAMARAENVASLTPIVAILGVIAGAAMISRHATALAGFALRAE